LKKISQDNIQKYYMNRSKEEEPKKWKIYTYYTYSTLLILFFISRFDSYLAIIRFGAKGYNLFIMQQTLFGHARV
jgi:hypothetical protein